MTSATIDYDQLPEDIRRMVEVEGVSMVMLTRPETPDSVCQQCRYTAKTLDRSGIHYLTLDTVTEGHPHREFATNVLGHQAVPVVLEITASGVNHWSGFRPDHIKRVAALSHAA